jgi:hypothetical protein
LPRHKLAANPMAIDRAGHVVPSSFTPHRGGIERQRDRQTTAPPTLGHGGEFLLQT